MIEVKYLDRLGNKLFQYCFGRILAEKLGYRLKAEPILGFPNTAIEVKGHDYSSYTEQILLGHFSTKIQRQKIDLEFLIKDPSKRRIVIDGYFQRYEYYQPYKEAIRKDWLATDLKDPEEKIGPEDIVVHVRRTDDALRGTAHPFSYYEEALQHARYDRVFICTDDLSDPFLKQFKKFNAIFSKNQKPPLVDFRFIMAFKKIILSASTFSWWAAFLSQANEIYAPIPLNGYWSGEYPKIDLKVNDESRYQYIVCKEIYRRTFAEHCAYQSLTVKNKIKNRLTAYLHRV